MSDVDGDSTMHSSPETDRDEEDLSPGAGPSTPRNAASHALDLASELSPPNSQSRPEGSMPTVAGGAPSMINANGKRAHPSSAAETVAAAGGTGDKKSGNVQTDPTTGYQWSTAEDAPGYEWRSNRAREEEARALEMIADKGSMIKTRYGDPLKPEVPMTLKR